MSLAFVIVDVFTDTQASIAPQQRSGGHATSRRPASTDESNKAKSPIECGSESAPCT